MPFDLRRILRDKRVMIGGVAVAGGAGLYALYRRSHGGGAGVGTAAEAAGSGTAPQGSAAGVFPDTSAQNAEDWFSQFGGQLQQELDQYQQQLTTALGGLNATNPPVSGSGGTGGVLPGAGSPGPIIPGGGSGGGGTQHPTPGTVHQSIWTVPWTRLNTAWNSTLSGIAAHEHTTVAHLMQLNPGIRDPNIIGSHQQIWVS
jgi:LysM repeat protein